MEFSFEPSEEKDVLQKYTRDLNHEVSNNKLNKIIGRDAEIRRIIEILSRKEKNNPVLLGEPGVGKTAIVEGFVQKIISKEVPQNLLNCKVYEVSLSSLIAGASFQGQFEKRLNSLIKEAKKSLDTIVLFIDEIHQLTGLGKTGSAMDAANILKPLMARGEIKIIGATTLNEYRQFIEKDAALERRFQKILVDEPSPIEALAIMRGLKEKWEIFHNVRINDNALVSSVKLSERYISDKFLPDKAIDLIDEAAAKIKTEAHTKPSDFENLEKKIFYLETERFALKKENNEKSLNRISEIEKELIELKNEKNLVEKEWLNQKEQQLKLSEIKKKIEKYTWDVDVLQNKGDYAQASKILYSTLPELKKQLKNIEEEISENKQVLIKDYVDELDVAEIISRITKIPLNKIFQKEQEKLLNLFTNMQKRVKGQDNALNLVCQTVLKNRVGINNPNRPIGSFLFLGTTGVGKTEVSKALAENLFDTEKSIIRINMSEYMEKHSISRLIGAPPGYVGFDQPGELSEAVRRKPYSVVLLDEIEKAHSEILNILLQVLDEGTLKDNQGRNINFKNTIIIMTSNVGSNYILENNNEMFDNELKKTFKSEFLNRIDEIVKFNTITKKDTYEITIKMLNDLKKRLNENFYLIDFDDSVINYICENSYSVQYGARPINRFIQKTIENFITDNIFKNNLKKDILYKIIYVNNKLEINKYS